MLRAVIISLTIILMRFSFSLKQTTGLSCLKLMRILKLSASNSDDFYHIWFVRGGKLRKIFYRNHNLFFISFPFFFSLYRVCCSCVTEGLQDGSYLCFVRLRTERIALLYSLVLHGSSPEGLCGRLLAGGGSGDLPVDFLRTQRASLPAQNTSIVCKTPRTPIMPYGHIIRHDPD